jgi:hypothetical protein
MCACLCLPSLPYSFEQFYSNHKGRRACGGKRLIHNFHRHFIHRARTDVRVPSYFSRELLALTFENAVFRLQRRS